MKTFEKCIICGAENIREYHSNGSIGIVEDNYYCKNCGYTYNMCYSKPVESIKIFGTKEDIERKQELLKENYDLIKKLNITVDPIWLSILEK